MATQAEVKLRNTIAITSALQSGEKSWKELKEITSLSDRGLTNRLNELFAARTIYKHEAPSHRGGEGDRRVVYGLPKKEAEARFQDMMTMYGEWRSEVEALVNAHHKDLRDAVITYVRMWALLNLKVLERMVKHPESEDAYLLVHSWTLNNLMSEFVKLLRKEDRSDESIKVLNTLMEEMLKETEKGN